MVDHPDLFQCVREWIVTYVVQKGGRAYDGDVIRSYGRQLATLSQYRERLPGKVIRTESVLETGMRRARVNQVCVSQLPDVSKSLKQARVYQLESQRIDTNVVPQRIANNLHLGLAGMTAVTLRAFKGSESLKFITSFPRDASR